MRDHPHHTRAIMGGMFGMRINKTHQTWTLIENKFEEIIQGTGQSHTRDLDQYLLW